MVYDVEVQTTDQRNLPRSMRYYQAMLDIAFFRKGMDYKEMRKSYVIFICNFDQYKEGRYIYTFENRCIENLELSFGDDAVKVVVNTKGQVGNISPELKEALLYFDHQEITGEYSRELDEAVEELKVSEERSDEYMTIMGTIAEAQTTGEYVRIVKQIRKWYNKRSKISIEDAADFAGITVPVFKDVVSQIEEHPDTDDDIVADMVDWEAT